MPGYDGTGPQGQGSRSGRGMGNCPPGENQSNPQFGLDQGGRPWGGGRGRGFGGGRGGRGRNRYVPNASLNEPDDQLARESVQSPIPEMLEEIRNLGQELTSLRQEISVLKGQKDTDKTSES